MTGPLSDPVSGPLSDPLSDPVTGAAPGWDQRAVDAGLSRQYTIYRQTMAVCDELAATAMQGAGPVELTTAFAKLIGKRVVLLDADFRLRAEAGGLGGAGQPRWDRSDPGVQRLLGALDVARRPLRIPSVPGLLLDEACLVAPVAVRDDTLGYLVVLDEPSDEPDDADFLSVTYAATLFALTLANERSSAELDLRYRRAVLEALVSGHFLDAEDARRKARMLGLDDDQPYRVAAIRVSGTAGSGLVDRLVDRLAGQVGELAGTVAAVRDSTVVAIFPEPAEGPAPEPVECLAGLAELTASVHADPPTGGVSGRLQRAETAPRGLRQAELAIDLGLRLGRDGQALCYDELGIYRLLFSIGDKRQLLQFADEVIGALLAQDRNQRVDLLRTLSVYLSNHGGLKPTARELGLHANTVAYRMQRIQALTGLDLNDADDRLLAHVAVKIAESHRT